MRPFLVVVAALLAPATDCGGEIAATGGVSTPCGSPPPDPGGATAPSSGTLAFAIRKLYLGDADRNGTASQVAWRSFGYDIDGLATTEDSVGPCRLQPGAARSTQIDGNCGIDNSFGANILPIVLTTSGLDYAMRLDASIEAGGFTDIIVVDAGARAASGVFAPASVVNGAALGHAPAWDGRDAWPIDSASFAGGSALATFERNYASGGTWVGVRSGAGAITLGTYLGFPFRIPIDRLTVTMRIASDGSGATSGVISGIVRTEAFIEEVRRMASATSTWPCGAACQICVWNQIRQASDALSDGSVDSTRLCDAISIGLGFEASAVQLGAVVDLLAPPDLCAPDAGSADARGD